MKVCLGDLIQSEFGTGPVVALTNEWVVHDTGDGHEAALPKDEGGFWVPVTEFGPHGSKQQQTRQSIEDEAKGNVVIAGDKVYAGVDNDDQSECTNAMVIEFKSAEDLRKAFNEARVEFTLFGEV